MWKKLHHGAAPFLCAASHGHNFVAEDFDNNLLSQPTSVALNKLDEEKIWAETLANSQSLSDQFPLLEGERVVHDYNDERDRCIIVAVDRTTHCVQAQHESLTLSHAISPEISGETAALTLSESLHELKELIRTADMSVQDVLVQRLSVPHALTYIGSGKLRELAQMVNNSREPIDSIVLDDDISPRQQRAIEDSLSESNVNVKVMDRTALILRIFARHARSKEAQLQVELATLQYHLNRGPKLMGKVEHESMRGKGESEKETERRVVKERMRTVRETLSHLEKQRELERLQRKHRLHSVPIVALVGYTNAGKSSLMNAMSNANVLAENKLFATLDTTTRKIILPKNNQSHFESEHAPHAVNESAEEGALQTRKGPEVLLVDTVGFISKLPHNLVSAFRSTLDTVRNADVLVLVVDRASPRWKKERETVLRELASLGCASTPIVELWNKIDLLDEEERERVRQHARENTLIGDTVPFPTLSLEGIQKRDHQGASILSDDWVSEEKRDDQLLPHVLLKSETDNEQDRGLAEPAHHHKHNREHKEKDLHALSLADQIMSKKKHKHIGDPLSVSEHEKEQVLVSDMNGEEMKKTPEIHNQDKSASNGKKPKEKKSKKSKNDKKKSDLSTEEEELLSLVWDEGDEYVRPIETQSTTSSLTAEELSTANAHALPDSQHKHATVAVSTLTGEGMHDLYATLHSTLSLFLKPITVFVPFSADQNLVTEIHRHGTVEEIKYEENGTRIQCQVPDTLWNKLKAFDLSSQ